MTEQIKKYYSNVLNLLDAEEKRRFEVLFEHVTDREKQERAFLEKTNFK